MQGWEIAEGIEEALLHGAGIAEDASYAVCDELFQHGVATGSRHDAPCPPAGPPGQLSAGERMDAVVHLPTVLGCLRRTSRSG